MAGAVRGGGYGLLALFLASGPVWACPFCTMQGQTLSNELDQASLVLYGSLGSPDLTSKPGAPEGTTDLKVEVVIKAHEILDRVLGKDKVLTLGRPLLPPSDGRYKYLVFCNLIKGRLDPYRGQFVPADSDMPRYLQTAAGHKGEPIGKRLRYFFDFLDNSDPEVSEDAYKEFANAGYGDYRDMARDLPADKIAGWLKDRRTPPFRLGLYGFMLGHCGKEAHIAVLRGRLEDPKTTKGIDGILAGYLLLRPREGWDRVCAILGDPRRELMQRYAALGTVRFFWEYRSDVVDKKELAEGVARLLEQKDLADQGINDLCKWQCWDMTGRILGLCTKEPYANPLVRRAILRFCLQCPRPEARRYVDLQRARDPQGVHDTEEQLKPKVPAAGAR
jgi:hypothetical protein